MLRSKKIIKKRNSMQSVLKTPLSYFGGKTRMLNVILPMMPKHTTYVEAFAGSASVFFAKKASPVEVINDVEHGIINFYRVLRDKDLIHDFERVLKLTPFSRDEFELCKNTWKEEKDPVEKARRWFVAQKQSFGCYMASWRYSRRTVTRGLAGAVTAWLLSQEQLLLIHYRLRTAQIESRDFRQIIPQYDTDDTFFYLDPPYMLETRGENRVYDCELETKDHVDLINLLKTLQGKALLSCYDHPVYEELEKYGWKKITHEAAATSIVPNRTLGKIGEGMLKDHRRTETLYYNYTLPTGEDA